MSDCVLNTHLVLVIGVNLVRDYLIAKNDYIVETFSHLVMSLNFMFSLKCYDLVCVRDLCLRLCLVVP